MKIKKIIPIIAVLPFLGLASCKSSGGGGQDTSPITAELLNIEGLEDAYKPLKSSINKKYGTLKVALVMDDTKKAGWQALADEYKRLHDNQVTVEIVGNYLDEANYKSALLEQESSTDSEKSWNIVQGNLVSNTSNLLQMTKNFAAKNYYAGDRTWTSVLDTYATKGSEGRILNTENLSTAWFVNKVALEAAGQKGYVNANGKIDNPVTWEDLINLCAKMVEAGYAHPLGLALDSASVESTQFTWLVRVYGDYYYRNEYNQVIAPSEEIDPETGEPTGELIPYELDFNNKQPEADTNFTMCYTNYALSILSTAETSEGDINHGAQSDKFKEFLTAMQKVKPYIPSDAGQKSFSTVRDKFTTQSDGKNSPQIMLDYFGSGLDFEKSEAITLDFFDYPYISEGVEINKIKDENEGNYPMVRDVGGNGGYLSVLNKGNTSKNELTLDFLKFVASPYGQSVYYQTMNKTGKNPQGITTVKKTVIPTEWKTFFESEKVQFNGNVDQNPYISMFVRFMTCSNSSSKKDSGAFWTELITGQGTKTTTVNQFQQEWQKDISADWLVLCKDRNWTSDVISKPEKWKTDWSDTYLKTGK